MPIDIAILRAAGLPAEKILEILELEQNEQRARTRELTRQRMRRYRARDAGDAGDASHRNASVEIIEEKKPAARKVDHKESKTLDSSLIEESEKSLSHSRGGRLPVTWRPSAADIEFGREHIGEAWHLEAEKFRDFWHGKPGAGGRKSDWPATWRNWIRKAAEGRKSNGFQRKTLRDVGEELVAELRAREDAALRGDGVRDPDAFGLPGNGGDLFAGIPGDAGGNVVPIPARGGGRGF